MVGFRICFKGGANMVDWIWSAKERQRPEMHKVSDLSNWRRRGAGY